MSDKYTDLAIKDFLAISEKLKFGYQLLENTKIKAEKSLEEKEEGNEDLPYQQKTNSECIIFLYCRGRINE